MTRKSKHKAHTDEDPESDVDTVTNTKTVGTLKKVDKGKAKAILPEDLAEGPASKVCSHFRLAL